MHNGGKSQSLQSNKQCHRKMRGISNGKAWDFWVELHLWFSAELWKESEPLKSGSGAKSVYLQSVLQEVTKQFILCRLKRQQSCLISPKLSAAKAFKFPILSCGHVSQWTVMQLEEMWVDFKIIKTIGVCSVTLSYKPTTWELASLPKFTCFIAFLLNKYKDLPLSFHLFSAVFFTPDTINWCGCITIKDRSHTNRSSVVECIQKIIFPQNLD